MYSTAQFKLMHAAWARHDMFFILHLCMCVHKNDDIETIVKSTSVHTRHVHDSFADTQEHTL